MKDHSLQCLQARSNFNKIAHVTGHFAMACIAQHYC